MVACQEVAHTFGLDHQDENFDNPNLGTCMDYTSDPDGTIKVQLSNLHPNAHDFEELVTMYTHLDSTTTVGQTVQKGAPADVDLSDVGSLGREIHRSADGRSSIFERDFGHGNKVITHVFWAEPRGK
jgi:hypothetical protein